MCGNVEEAVAKQPRPDSTASSEFGRIRMAMTIHVDIVSAEGHLFSGLGEMVYAPAIMGGSA